MLLVSSLSFSWQMWAHGSDQIETDESMDSHHHPSNTHVLWLHSSVILFPSTKCGLHLNRGSWLLITPPSSVESPGKRGEEQTHGELRRSTQTGTKACHEGSCLPLLETHILPWLCRQRLGPPRQISPGGYYRPEDKNDFQTEELPHTHTQRCTGSDAEDSNASRMVPFF